MGLFFGSRRESSTASSKCNNVFVKVLSESTTDEDLKKIIGEFGRVASAVVMRDCEGKSKCFGCANFESADDVARAVKELNGKKYDEKQWYVESSEKI